MEIFAVLFLVVQALFVGIAIVLNRAASQQWSTSSRDLRRWHDHDVSPTVSSSPQTEATTEAEKALKRAA